MEEKPALLIIDMVKDYFKDENNYPITPLARKIIPPTNILIRQFRKQGFQPFLIPVLKKPSKTKRLPFAP